jgi:two-component system chemotaxis sensor kinase CheA
MPRSAREQRLFEVFLEELEEHQKGMSHDLLALEQSNDQDERRALLESMFRAAHSLKGAARSVQASAVERICHALEQHFQDLRRNNLTPGPAQLRAWFDDLDALAAEAHKLAGNLRGDSAPPSSAPGVAAPKPSEPEQSAAAAVEPSAGAAKPEPRAANEASAKTSDKRAARDALADKRVLRVSTEKADLLVNKTADLVTLTSMLDGRLGDFDELRALVKELRAPRSAAEREATLRKLERGLDQSEENFRRGVHAVVRGSERVDDEAQRLRLVPFTEACEGLDRAARDLALSVNKPFELQIESHGVEIDRAIAQRLRDPLLHLLRNAVTHGIESPAERAAAQKPASARVRIEAALRGKAVEVVLSDDGHGFDLERIRQVARSQELDFEVSERELLNYAFLPSFSTASSVTELSGRGVGLDAVKRAIDGVHGTIEVESLPGRGARFVMRLPLTLSKLRCFFVMASGRWYALPATHVRRVLSYAHEDVTWVEGRALIKTTEGLLPLTSLAHVLGLSSEKSKEPRALLVLAGDERNIALLVDELGAEREVTARALPARLSGIRQVSSVTFLALGRMALVLHPQELCRRALSRPLPESARPAASDQPKPRILIAEDSATTRAVLKSLLEEAHYDVTTAQDGEEAYNLLQQRAFDLVLSDVQMPHKDGITLTEDIRGHEQLFRLPVVLMTSLDSEADRLRGLKAGASAYLTKSAFDHPVLLATIASLL